MDLYTKDYFLTRQGNDSRRLRSFEAEASLLRRFVNFNGRVCDVGCSTGEFLTHVNWTGQKFGIEVSEYAKDLAVKQGISFQRNIFTELDFFDLVVFRGTIQHLPNPFEAIQKTSSALRPGGFVAFLMTPNAGSLTYRVAQDLPALDAERNFWIPSVKALSSVLRNEGLVVCHVDYPYLNSPYSEPLSDFFDLLLSTLSRKKPKRAFPGNMFNLVALRPE